MMLLVMLSVKTSEVVTVARVFTKTKDIGFFVFSISVSATNSEVPFGGKIFAQDERRACNARMPEFFPNLSSPNRASTSAESPRSLTKITASAPLSRARVAFERTDACCEYTGSFAAHFGTPRRMTTILSFTSIDAKSS